MHDDARPVQFDCDPGNGVTDGENRVLLETTNYATTEALIRTALRRIAENRRS